MLVFVGVLGVRWMCLIKIVYVCDVVVELGVNFIPFVFDSQIDVPAAKTASFAWHIIRVRWRCVSCGLVDEPHGPPHIRCVFRTN